MSYKRADGLASGRQVPIFPTSSTQSVCGTEGGHLAEERAKSLFEKYNETLREHHQQPKSSLITKGLVSEGTSLKSPEAYAQPFCDFLTENPTVFHAVDYFEQKLEAAGFKKLSERKTWTDELEAGGKYFVTRNGSSLIAFAVGKGYKSGNGVAMAAGHVDALTARLKPVSNKKTSAGYVQLGVAPYAGALNSTWWDRDLGIGGRVVVKDEASGKISTKLVKLAWPIARIPSLAPHFGVGMLGTNNAETEAVPIIGLDNSDISSEDEEFKNFTLGAQGTFAATQPPKLVRAIAGELSINDYSSIINWELELFDTQPAQVGGLEKEFIFAGRVDDKICSWVAIEGLIASAASPSGDDGIVKLVGVFDDEEIGSLLRQGARGNFLPGTVERISEAFSKSGSSANILSQTYANSFLLSADVTHAVNPNFLSKYLEGHAPRLNVGLSVAADSNGHMTTDSISTALLTRIAEKCDSKLQIFQIRNDSRSGGTVGPMLSSAMGVRAIDAGIAQLSMHSIRATVGNLDPGLGVKIFKGFFDHFEVVDGEFAE
ncbi:related to vacuolar aspartyl aminopeptidase Lap4 [Phialocephala subalpina]|uniref:Related to vacuolar aspartyl aminopeptidase Lap4 n=1 Tax=Phialocephala subalpina TaxID=576137 RepID=A0A1L7XXG6_9HELO|nr:related to vacuolar aspartyl aminopeptidase Lap4 [Phialocephala subalpina]